MATNHRMAGLRCLFDHSRLLADDSSLCRTMARTTSLSIHGAVAGVGGNVGGGRTDYTGVARHPVLSRRLGVGGGGSSIRLRAIRVFAIREELQRQATRRLAGSSRRESRPAAGNGWN